MLLLSGGVPVYPPYYGSCVQIPILDISKDSDLSQWVPRVIVKSEPVK